MKLHVKSIFIAVPLVLSLSYCVSCTSTFYSSQGQLSDGTLDLSYERAASLPAISPISDQRTKNNKLLVTPELEQSLESNAVLYWSKEYGPDDVEVHPETGEVTWEIDSDLPSESFHIGLKVSSLNDTQYIDFIVHHNVPDVVTVGANSDYPTISEGLNNLVPGGTLIVESGVYEGEENYVGFTDRGAFQHPPSGNENSITTVMARSPGQVTLQNGAYIRLQAIDGVRPVSYAAFKGFFVKGGQIAAFGLGKSKKESSYRPHHIKFIRNGVEGGEKHSPFNAFRSDNILFENNYAFGGGRYKFASYQAENIVMRRNVARYDRGTVANEPKGTYSVYTTLNAVVNNNIAVDGDHHEFVNQGELAGEFTTPTTSGHTRAKFHRNLQLNSAFLFGNMDEQISSGGGDSDVEHKNTVSWDVRPYSRYVMTWGSAWFNHMTMGNVNPRHTADQFFNGFKSNARGLTNSILHNFQNGNMFYELPYQESHSTVGRKVQRFGVDTVNITDFSGELVVYKTTLKNISEIDPIYRSDSGGLRYLTRLERGSDLTALSKDKEPLGATLLTMKGKSGTFFGEEGFNDETLVPMWPFPLERIIKSKFAQYQYEGPTYTGHYTKRVQSGVGTLTGSRGFAIEGQTLSNYVWGYLGDVVPPLASSASITDSSITVQWDMPSEISEQNVSSYRIYDYDLSSGQQVLLSEIDKDNRVVTINGLESGTKYAMGITAVAIDGKESAVGYPVIVNTL